MMIIKKFLRVKAIGVIFLVLMMGLITAPGAKAASIDLGTAGPLNWAVLGLGGNVAILSGTVESVFPGFANVGVNPIGPVSGGGDIDGDLVLHTDTIKAFLGTIGGAEIIDDAKLEQAEADAIDRSAFYAGLATTDPTTTINTGTTIIGSGGLNVLNLTGGLSLLGETLTLQGTAADAFVINVPAGFTMTGASNILVDGGVLPHNVLINLLGVGGYSFLGDEINGIILAPIGSFNAHGLILGELIANQVALASGAVVRNPAVPVPPSAILLGSGLLGLGLLGGRKHWFH
jgi:choice-of-anchor A domain-containing protein